MMKRVQSYTTMKSRKWQWESVTEARGQVRPGEVRRRDQVTYRVTHKETETTGNSDTRSAEKVGEQALHELRDEGRNLKLKR